jgi:hypothetical protein
VRAREQGQEDMMHAEETHYMEEPLAYGTASFADLIPAVIGTATNVLMSHIPPTVAVPVQQQQSQPTPSVAKPQPELFGGGE